MGREKRCNRDKRAYLQIQLYIGISPNPIVEHIWDEAGEGVRSRVACGRQWRRRRMKWGDCVIINCLHGTHLKVLHLLSDRNLYLWQVFRGAQWPSSMAPSEHHCGSIGGYNTQCSSISMCVVPELGGSWNSIAKQLSGDQIERNLALQVFKDSIGWTNK